MFHLTIAKQQQQMIAEAQRKVYIMHHEDDQATLAFPLLHHPAKHRDLMVHIQMVARFIQQNTFGLLDEDCSKIHPAPFTARQRSHTASGQLRHAYAFQCGHRLVTVVGAFPSQGTDPRVAAGQDSLKHCSRKQCFAILK
jgi:hypothetical protein